MVSLQSYVRNSFIRQSYSQTHLLNGTPINCNICLYALHWLASSYLLINCVIGNRAVVNCSQSFDLNCTLTRRVQSRVSAVTCVCLVNGHPPLRFCERRWNGSNIGGGIYGQLLRRVIYVEETVIKIVQCW